MTDLFELSTRRAYLDAYDTLDEAVEAAVAFGPGDYEVRTPDAGEVPGSVVPIRVGEDGEWVDLSDRDAREGV